MKKGWEQKPFESCIEPVEYTRKVQRKDFLLEGQFPIVSQEAEFTNGFWDDEADVFKLSKPVIIFGDHTQVLKYVDFDFVLGADGVKILQPRDFLWPKFFFYQLQAAELPSLGYARHYRLLKVLEISVPPLAEQRRIVGVLDEAFAGLATAQAHAAQNLRNARALFESHLQSVFTHRGKAWVDATLADVLAVLRNGVNCKQDKSGMGSKISRIESIWNARFDITRVGYAEIPEAQKDKFLLKKGDVLFSHINSAIHVGKTALFDLEDEVVHGVNLLLMRTKSFILPAYLDLYLKHIFSVGYWLRVCKQSINQASVNQQDINRVPFCYPDLERQREIVEQMDALAAETQRLTRLYEQKQAALVALKKSLLHQAFAGGM